MAAAVTAIATNETCVRQFLQSLFEKQALQVTTDAPTPDAAPATVAVPLRLHPHVDAAHPLGSAHTSRELEAALRLYTQLGAGMCLEVEDVLLGPDKALCTGHLVVQHHLTHLAAAAAPRVGAAVSSFPGPLRSLAEAVLPEGSTPSRVPISIQLRLGKDDLGHAVVTHLSLVFSLLSVLLPHLALTQWQHEKLLVLQPKLLSVLQQSGSAAAVIDDTMTSLRASCRAGAAVLQATVGQVLSAAQQQVQYLWTRKSSKTA